MPERVQPQVTLLLTWELKLEWQGEVTHREGKRERGRLFMMVCQIERQVRTDCSAALSLSLSLSTMLVCQPISSWRSALPGGPRHPADGGVKFSLQPEQRERERRRKGGVCYCFGFVITALPILQIGISHPHRFGL